MDVIDVDSDPLAQRSRRRQSLLRIGLPLAGVGLIIGFLLGITVYADRANRAGVLGLSDTLLRTMQERIALQVSAYLEPAAHATLLSHSMLGRGGATEHADAAQAFAASILQETPQIANVLFADAAGNFMLVRRAVATPSGGPPSGGPPSGGPPSGGPPSGGPLPGGTETKRVLVASEGRHVEWITRDPAGQVIARREDPADSYDARTRSWFSGARAADDVFWTGVYIFFSERAPGITAAVHGPDADPDVVGVDIRLDEISRFLGGLSIGRTGRAYIASKTGEMIAGPDPARILRTQNGQLAPARVDEIGDANLAASWDHFRVNGPGDRIIDVGGERIISIVTPLANNSQGWLLCIAVPEAEFSGFVGDNSRRAALLSLIVVAVAAGLGVLLVRQGLRADRAARVVAERSEAVRQQSAAFARLATEAGMFNADGSPPRAMTETLAAATGARRAGLWRVLGGGQVLRCEDSFEPATGGHVFGLELSRQEVPTLIEALTTGQEINAPQARSDRRTAALHASLMAPFGSAALFAVPVMHAGRAVGVVMLEDARRDPAALDFARACATLLTLRTPIEAAVARPLSTAGVAFVEPAADGRGFDAGLATFDLGEGKLAVQVRAQATVLVLRLSDAAMARAVSSGAGPESLAHRIACAAHEIARTHAIPYVKMLGTSIVAVAGYTATDAAAQSDAAVRLADVAIALRECCAGLFEDDEGLAGFSLGLDAGLVLGGTLGQAPGLFNLWGEAPHGAQTLASSAPAGAIQTSEQAYLLLRQGFLFRPRGLFHRPRGGATRSYVLAGRA